MPEQKQTSAIDFGNLSQRPDLRQRELSITDVDEVATCQRIAGCPASSLNQGELKRRTSKLAEPGLWQLVDNELNYSSTDPKTPEETALDFYWLVHLYRTSLSK